MPCGTFTHPRCLTRAKVLCWLVANSDTLLSRPLSISTAIYLKVNRRGPRRLSVRP